MNAPRTARRGFLRALGAGLGLAAAPAALVQLVEAESVRRYWQVPGNAPVGPDYWATRGKARDALDCFREVYDPIIQPFPDDESLLDLLPPIPLDALPRAYSDQAVLMPSPVEMSLGALDEKPISGMLVLTQPVYVARITGIDT